MPYATVDDLQRRYGADELVRLTDRTGTGQMDATTVERALTDADAEIDSYLSSRYPLPLSPVPPVLVRLACDIARYRLWEDRASDEVRRRYEDARRFLEAVAKGMISLGLPEAVAAPPMAGVRLGNARVFRRSDTEGY